jgi:hypothetical protein
MAITIKKLFLASSAELREDRKEFEILINRKNKDWVARGVFLELVVWEDFLDMVSSTRLQDEYNKAIRECDIFVMLFWTKVGQYTEEEFETAFGQFKTTNKPFIFTYFKDAEISTASIDRKHLMSLWAFQEKLGALGHFYTVYKNVDELKLKFSQQLDKLAANGFIEFNQSVREAAGPVNLAELTGSGAIAQGSGALAVGRGGVIVGSANTGTINTGTQISGDLVRGEKVLGSKIGSQINTGGGAYVGGKVNAGGDFVGRDKTTHGDRITTGDLSGTGIAIGRGARANVTQGISPHELEPLFAPLLAAVAQEAPADNKAAAVQQVQELKREIAKGEQAQDGKIARILDGLAGMAPAAVGSVVRTFATPILGGLAGPVTKFVLEKLKSG